MKATRGLSLIEMLTAMAIMGIVVAITGRLVVEGVRMARNAEETVDGNDASRLALDGLSRDVLLAGTGTGGGLWVNRGGIPARINSVFGGTGATPGTDDLWLVVPHAKTMRQSCLDRGAATSVVVRGLGVLRVTCTTSFLPQDTLLVTNMKSAALLTQLTFTTLGGYPAIDYAESGLANFSNAPDRGGFQVGDMAFPVSLVHYFIAVAPATGRPALYRALANFQSVATGVPFADVAGSATVVVHNIEDLQVAFGVDTGQTGDPANILFQSALGADYTAGLRSVRLSVVSLSRRQLLNGQDQFVQDPGYAPLSVEDHASAAVVDGRRRSLYSRRVELVNLDPGSL